MFSMKSEAKALFRNLEDRESNHGVITWFAAKVGVSPQLMHVWWHNGVPEARQPEVDRAIAKLVEQAKRKNDAEKCPICGEWFGSWKERYLHLIRGHKWTSRSEPAKSGSYQ